MGQNLKYIITTEELKVPINIVHFKERNAIIFAILMEDYAFNEMCDDAKDSTDNVSDFFNMILCGGYNLEYPMKNLFEFIANSGLTSLAIISYSEIMDLTQNIGIPFLFLENKLVDLSGKEISEEEIHKSLNAEITFSEIIRNEAKYWGYEDMEIYYLENLKNGK